MEVYIVSLQKVLSGIPVTMSLTVWSVLLALLLGIILSIGVFSPIAFIKKTFIFLCGFLKGIPILVFLYVFNTAIDTIMAGVDSIFAFYTYDIRKPPTFIFAVFAFALSYAPYMCDMITTSMESIPKGQWEACDAGGFTTWQKMTRIIIPQCVVVAVPVFGNHFVNLLKASSLACMVTIMEMMGEARNYATLSQKFLECYWVCALCYWLVFIVFERIFYIIEKRSGSYLQPGMIPGKRKRRLFGFKRITIADQDDILSGGQINENRV